MNPQTDPKKPIHNPLVSMQPGEEVICEIKRHPIGMLTIFAGATMIIILIAVVLFAIVPQVVTSVPHNQMIAISFIIFLFVSFLTLGFVLIANKVYWGNRWILTSDSVTQVSQYSLFDRQSSQLSMGNLEDVTTEKSGIFPHMFNYGVLKCETAGERSKFMFTYCPNPDYYAQQILSARERFEQFSQNNRGRGNYQPTTPGQAGVNVGTE